MTERGQLYVISAPSGAGKTTLVHRLIQRFPDLRFSVSYTTRPARSGEVDGRDYHFVSQEIFDDMAAGGEFLEFAQVFDHHYATGKEAVNTLLDAGTNVLLEIDWQGARQVRQNMPQACFIFIMPPSVEVLETRLRSRGTDSEAVIQRRFGDAISDMAHWQDFDHVIVNDDLDTAAAQLAGILAGEAAQTRVNDPLVERQIRAITGSPA